ncbi:hypothetical protein H0H81_003618 [Sphagnurus paluster]|uniref:Uncharacterized protein n=1 Tax=Sphagnurus paluster TaxID=117069 RepID=A0A9P7K2B7_9AGAR|nr:hypothetical protein H0H81_003618 [Sphagnurus paluster]
MSIPKHDGICPACSSLGPDVNTIKNRAQAPPSKRAFNILSHWQLVKKVRQLNANLNAYKLKALNQSRKISTQKKTLDCYRELHDLMAREEIPALSRLLRAGKDQGWSIKKLNMKARAALVGDYCPHGYSDLEKDLAILVYELGGGAALHALNHSTTALPSLMCINPLRREIKFRITVGDITMSDVLANIETGFKDVGPGHYKTGITLSFDELAIEQRLRWLADTDQIAGLCHHAKILGSLEMGEDMEVVSGIARAVRKMKDVHVAHEATVYWKYNILQHLEKRHPSVWQEHIRQNEDSPFLTTITISCEEENKLGVVKNKVADNLASVTAIVNRAEKRPLETLATPTQERHRKSTKKSNSGVATDHENSLDDNVFS